MILEASKMEGRERAMCSVSARVLCLKSSGRGSSKAGKQCLPFQCSYYVLIHFNPALIDAFGILWNLVDAVSRDTGRAKPLAKMRSLSGLGGQAPACELGRTQRSHEPLESTRDAPADGLDNRHGNQMKQMENHAEDS